MLSKVCARNKYALYGIDNNGSADILALAEANCFTMIKEKGSVKKGGSAKFLRW